jgi:arylsulfatase A-like enzyme
MNHRIRQLLVPLCLALLPALTLAAEPRKPNIVFILADDLGYGDLGCYGQKLIQTPHLDRLAADGMRFTQCYAGSTVCAPSRCTLMTGLHTGHAVIRGNAAVPLRADEATVAKLLQDAGYATGVIGKWGLGEADTTGVPNRQGFDYFYGYLNQVHAHNYYPDYLWNNGEKVMLKGNEIGDTPGVSVKRAQYSHDLFTAEALAFLDKHKDRPFFLYLAYTIPHANNERTKAEGNGMEVPDDSPYTNKQWPPQEKNRAAMVTRMDRDVGALMKRLKELKLDDDTIVFCSSDNGPHKEGGNDPKFFESSGPFRGIKRDLYEGGIRMPLLARWPGKIKEGTVSDHVCAFWDFLPTAAELCGTKAPKGIDGLSLVPTLLGAKAAGREQEKHDFLYWEFHEGGTKQAVRTGDWKAVRLKPKGPLELYDLKADPGEKKNVADKQPDVVEKIETYLKTARTESKDWPIK